MSILEKRLVFSTLFIAISCLAIFAAPLWIFALVVEAFCLLAFYEFLAIAEKKGITISRPLALTSAALIPLLSASDVEPLILVLACLAGLMIGFRKENQSKAMVATAVMMLGLVYVVWFFAHFIKMKELVRGSLWVFYTILLAKGGDAGAYFVGTKIGRIKLIENISPNKSVEGAWGGLATTILLSLASKIYLPYVSWMHLFVLGTLVAVISQLADLVESLLKRDVGIKDSGVIPGLGGILDVLDSLLLTVPFVYYYLMIFHIA